MREAAIGDRENLELRIVASWRERLARGDEVDPAAELAAHPESADRLKRALAALRLLHRAYRSPAPDADPPRRGHEP